MTYVKLAIKTFVKESFQFINFTLQPRDFSLIALN